MITYNLKKPMKCRILRSPALASESESQTQFSIQSNWHFWRLCVNRSQPISLNIQSIFKVIKYWAWFNRYNRVNQFFVWWLWVYKKLVKRVISLEFFLSLHLPPLSFFKMYLFIMPALLQCMGSSLQWLCTGSRAHGLSSCGLWALEFRLSGCGSWP